MGAVPRKFRRHDGVIGVGYWIVWAGLDQASVSWPDAPANRYTQMQFDRGDVEDLGELQEIPEPLNAEQVHAMGLQQVCGTEAVPEVSNNVDLDKITIPATPQTAPESLGGLSLDQFRAVYGYLKANPNASIPQAIEHLATIDVVVTTEQVAGIREDMGLAPLIEPLPEIQPPADSGIASTDPQPLPTDSVQS
jgi:hypothetical protein